MPYYFKVGESLKIPWGRCPRRQWGESLVRMGVDVLHLISLVQETVDSHLINIYVYKKYQLINIVKILNI